MASVEVRMTYIYGWLSESPNLVPMKLENCIEMKQNTVCWYSVLCPISNAAAPKLQLKKSSLIQDKLIKIGAIHRSAWSLCQLCAQRENVNIVACNGDRNSTALI